MRFLKAILYTILIICIAWGALILGGAPLVKYAAKMYFGDQIELHGVSVSPKLSVSITRAVFGPDLKEPSSASGSLRGININWSLFLSEPSVSIKVGFLNVSEPQLLAEGIQVKIREFNDFKNLPVDMSLQKLFVNDLSIIKGVSLKSYLNTDIMQLTKNILNVDNIQLKMGSNHSIDSLVGAIDQISLKRSLFKQVNTFDFSTRNINSDALGFKSNSSTSTFENEYGIIYLKTTVNDLYFDENGGSENSSSVTFSSELRLSAGDAKLPLIIVAKDLHLPLANLNFRNLSINLSDMMDPEELKISGEIERFRVQNDGQFIATFEDVGVEILARFNLDNGLLDLQGESYFITGENDYLELQADFDLIDFVLDDIANCFYTTCYFDELSASYRLSSENGMLTGQLVCNYGSCLNKPAKHELSIENSNLMLEDLGATKFFNPIILALLYYEIRRGVPTETGHILNLIEH